MKFLLPLQLLGCCLLTATLSAADTSLLPAGSVVGNLGANDRVHLVSPLELGSYVRPGGYRLRNLGFRHANRELGSKLGRQALVFYGAGNGKGDFGIGGPVPGKIKAIGCWMHAPADGNLREVGFQFYDKEGEALIYLRPVDWSGWKWIEVEVNQDNFKQAYPQQTKNNVVDMPVRGTHIVWWGKQDRLTELGVDAVLAKVEGQGPSTLQTELILSDSQPRDETFGGSIMMTNGTDQALHVQVELSLQQDGRLFKRQLPTQGLGLDHALTARSWTMADGKRIAENTLTDGIDYTAAATDYRTDFWEHAEQYVELDQIREITALGWQSGDANWIWQVDVASSVNGDDYVAVPELQGVALHKKWGKQRFPDFAAFRAKSLRFRYHNQGQRTNVVRMPSALMVWDGDVDEQWELPQAGRELGRKRLSREVPARSFAIANFEFDESLPTGQYLLASKIEHDKHKQLGAQAVFVEPAWLDSVDDSSRFGLNASQVSLAKSHRKLGIGWVRFENFKWPMVSPADGEYAFDGSVGPWHVNIDEITKEYRQAGLHVLPMMFQTPEWASSAESAPAQVQLSQPPRDNRDFGEFAWQSVARYGSQELPTEALKTKDKLSGLGRIRCFELGNEPNLNPLRDPAKPPSWGPWAGTMKQWWETWRHGADAVKRADPNSMLLSPGFAGATSEIVDQMRAHKYPDGKTPLQMIDGISVHFYSGRTPPEVATDDANNGKQGSTSFLEHLKRLREWRDRHRPGIPIWMTETGYDTGGPIGTNEWTQAARLPRIVSLCLANGVDKVFVYREKGSRPSQHAASGLHRDDLSRTPAWYTYATLIRQLQGAKPGPRLPHPNPNVWLQVWKRNDEAMLMANTVTGEAVFAIDAGAANVTDAFGGISQIDDAAKLKLTEFPQYLTGFTRPQALVPLVRKARTLERSRAEQRAKAAKQQIYLFNFGKSPEAVALDSGRIRYYRPVPAELTYEARRGFGFVDGPASRNDLKSWKAELREQHSVKLDKGQAFQWDVLPGIYELQVGAEPWQAIGPLTLTGCVGGSKELPFRKGEQEVVTIKIEVRESKLAIQGTYQHLLRWLVMKRLED